MMTCLGLVIAVAVAQDDVEFARGLARRGYYDLAEEMCGRVLQNSSASAETKANVSFVMAEVMSAKAEAEPDLKKSQDLVDEAVALLKKFLKEQASSPLANDARSYIGWLHTRKASLLTNAMKAEESPEKSADLRKRAAQAYADAEGFYKSCIDEFKAAPQQTPAIQNALMDARMELPRTMLEHAKLAGVDDDVRKKLLTDAKNLLEDFEFDYGDRPIQFEAMLIEGQCLTELSDFQTAGNKIRAAIGLRKALADAKIPANDYHLSVIRGAYVALAQMHLRAGNPKDAVAAVDQAFKENKGLEHEGAGLGLMLEKAQALFELGDVAKADDLAKKVLAADPNGKYGTAAKERTKAWVSTGRGKLKAAPDQLLTAAESHMDKDQVREALQMLRRCIDACATSADQRKYAPSAYFKMGQCFLQFNPKRFFEAAFAFENVFKLYPEHELAPKACFEAVRCYANEFNLSGDKRDDDMKEAYLDLLRKNWPNHPSARNIAYLQAEKMEKAKEYRKAADLYLQVHEDAEAYESALVSAGTCFYADATAKWNAAPKPDVVRAEVRTELLQGEEPLKKFLARLTNSALTPKEPELVKLRTNLSSIANQWLALIYMHEAVGRRDECLKFLDECAKSIPPDDERLAKIWELKIRALVALKKVSEATEILDRMFEKFPDGLAIAQASRSVAINLHQITADMIEKKGDEAAIRENLKRISKYYSKWLYEGPTRGMRVTMADALSVAETLYMIAKRLNGLEDSVVSFLDLKGKTIQFRQYFVEAAFVHGVLVEGKVGKLPDKTRLELVTRLARCYSFVAENAKDWQMAKTHYTAIVKEFKLVDASDRLNDTVLQGRPSLLSIYAELGYVYFELGKSDSTLKFQFDNALTVFSNVLRASENGSEPWWIAKYMSLCVLYERGQGQDIRNAKVGVDNLERNNPDFDGGKFQMKEKFLELKKKLEALTGGR